MLARAFPPPRPLLHLVCAPEPEPPGASMALGHLGTATDRSLSDPACTGAAPGTLTVFLFIALVDNSWHSQQSSWRPTDVYLQRWR